MQKNIGLIGLGAIGTPIADKLNQYAPDNFYLIASGAIKKNLEASNMFINDVAFHPNIVSGKSETEAGLDLFIICVKNYDLDNSLSDFQNAISEKTIILPLQNGLYSYDFFSKQFPDNVVLQGFVKGPNTTIDGAHMYYQNPGEMYIGSDIYKQQAQDVYKYLKIAGVSVYFEEDINRKIWKKWMLNVAGNSVTALTEADYSIFKEFPNIQTLCTRTMKEFQKVANAEGVDLSEKDIQDVIDYYVHYNGNKKTSMLVDVLNKRKTENEYLAGHIIHMAEKHGIEVPIIQTLYYLLTLKEAVYTQEKLL